MAFGKSLGDLTKGAGGLVENLSGATLGNIGDAALEKVNGLIDEFKGAMASLATFGFSVEQLDVSMGIPPTIKTGIHGSISAVREDEVKAILSKHGENALLTKLLNGLLTLKRLSEGVRLKNDTVNVKVTLGIMPAIEFSVGG